MERVVFMIEETGQRIGCMLNPESVVVTRQAGLRARSTGDGLIGGGMDQPMLATGGGRTDLDLELLFDLSLTSNVQFTDVRELTRPLMMLAENSVDDHGRRRPPLVRFFWGTAWNIPGLITSVAERFDRFSAEGTPLRSWMTLRLRRVAAADEPTFEAFPVPIDPSTIADAPPGGEVLVADGDGSDDPVTRIDLMAADSLGSAVDWRLIAVHNDLDDPLSIPAGTPLSVPERRDRR